MTWKNRVLCWDEETQPISTTRGAMGGWFMKYPEKPCRATEEKDPDLATDLPNDLQGRST
jgi:hypothetical protein